MRTVLSPELIELVALFLSDDLPAFVAALAPWGRTPALKAFVRLQHCADVAVAWPLVTIHHSLAPATRNALRGALTLRPAIEVVMPRDINMALLVAPYGDCITRVRFPGLHPMTAVDGYAMRDALLALPRLRSLELSPQIFAPSDAYLNALLETLEHKHLTALHLHAEMPRGEVFLDRQFAINLVRWLQRPSHRCLSLRSVRVRLDDDPVLLHALRDAIQLHPQLSAQLVHVDIFDEYVLHGERLPQVFRPQRWASSLVASLEPRPVDRMARAIATPKGDAPACSYIVEAVDAPSLPTFLVTSHGTLQEMSKLLTQTLPTLPWLRLVHLHKTTGDDLARLVEVLPRCQRLSHLVLSGPNLTPPVVATLLRRLPQCPSIRWLGLQNHTCTRSELMAMDGWQHCVRRLEYMELSCSRWSLQDKAAVLSDAQRHMKAATIVIHASPRTSRWGLRRLFSN
ncbi:hypothetical protein SDRG_13797 [Saprolegnia diclina VS20]|uniref:F-box domain-containing protein n=1 Tax=Saprolegnia diclina (strain VS20) TaxID=1156394 RepID=T0PSM1_SAPDV|nr:hypothetical protein SDRG_13797 [Saprolegnia diclina VS20]EQC28469.1 hypothetical protein SDRG_13797 [Saprolegnia diclina VS20]|eukprot:XP_008618117.1 hypothetical protein SDRG_13797 [Saprolegnia diclina VS20]